MRRLPTLSFELDVSFDNADYIDALLRTPVVAADVTGRDDDESGGESGGESDDDGT